MGWYRFLIGTLLQLPRKCNYYNLIGIAEPAWAITGILVQHRYNTDTTLDTNRMIYRNVYHVMGIDGFLGGEFGGYRGPGSWGLPP